ncbi:MAG TPA: LuxR C-terminal-related transcriptional regulator [Polyangiaceae bacterium]|nr:LuxR C-terminal-related transcriptional regulator [Polyangiaceae bacterium]
MISQPDPIAVVEAAYAPAANDTQWLDALTSASRPMLDLGRGVFSLIHDTHDPEWVGLRGARALGLDASFMGGFFGLSAERGDETRAMVRIFRTVFVTSASRQLLRAPPRLRRQFAAVLGAGGFADAHVVNATDPSNVGVMFVAPTERGRPWSPQHAHRWSHLAAHVAAGLRIRRIRAQLDAAGARLGVEAVVRPDGHIEHADECAKGKGARAALRLGALAMERARGPLRRCDPDEAIAIWEGLLGGRWSLVEHYDSDGRRYLLAHRNDPDAPDVRGLTLRERQVIAYAAAGHPNKIIAYELGLTSSTVAGHLARARAKLALPSLEAVRKLLAVPAALSS